ncbi:MAG: polysaccharide pyruvyl transferase family protein [Chitinophagaceae bacterium]|nr:polysaccharide pyruvyl transferase family protein [Chitinophagaceae bacterium]
MNQNNYITLLDPSLQNNKGEPSNNLGDIIIYDSIIQILKELFPGKEIIRISTHVDFLKKDKEIINNSLYTFVGGTNILTSDIRHFLRLTPVKNKGFYFFPGIKNLILFGTGWTSYQTRMDWATKIYYKKVLSNKIRHSVRDIYSLNQLKEAGFKNVVHTSCPTTWNIDTSLINKFNPAFKNILFTLTSYYPEESADNKLLELILNTAPEETYFFPQTKTDTEYLATLPFLKKYFKIYSSKS